MKLTCYKAVMVLLGLLTLISFTIIVYGYQITSMDVNVTLIGYAVVTHKIAINDAPTVVEVPTIGYPDIIIAIDEDGNPIAHNITNDIIKLYVVDNTTIELTYATATPITKEKNYWNILIKAFMPCSVIMRKDMVILDVKPLPKRVTKTDDTLILYFDKGVISINYTIIPVITTTTSTTSTPTTQPSTTPTTTLTTTTPITTSTMTSSPTSTPTETTPITTTPAPSSTTTIPPSTPSTTPTTKTEGFNIYLPSMIATIIVIGLIASIILFKRRKFR